MNPAPQDRMPEVLVQIQRAGPGASHDILVRAVKRNPGDPRYLVLLAAELIHSNQLDRAEAAYIAALNLAPGWGIARFQLGLLQFTLGRFSTALATWAPLEALPEQDPLRLFRQGLEALVLDDVALARQRLIEGMALNTENPPLNRDMQLILDRIASATSSTGAPKPPAQPTEVPAAAGGEHFFVSSYGRPR